MKRSQAIAKALREAMDEADLNQADIARKSGLSQKQIGLILAGRIRQPHPTTINALQNAVPGFSQRYDAVAA